MIHFVYKLCCSTSGQIQYGRKIGDMIRDHVRILYLLFLLCDPIETLSVCLKYLPLSEKIVFSTRVEYQLLKSSFVSVV